MSTARSSRRWVPWDLSPVRGVSGSVFPNGRLSLCVRIWMFSVTLTRSTLISSYAKALDYILKYFNYFMLYIPWYKFLYAWSFWLNSVPGSAHFKEMHVSQFYMQLFERLNSASPSLRRKFVNNVKTVLNLSMFSVSVLTMLEKETLRNEKFCKATKNSHSCFLP